MKRLNRTLVATVLIAVLLAAMAPAAQALPAAKPQTSAHFVGGDWLSAALNWLGQFFDRTPRSPEAQQKKTPTTSGDSTTSTGSFGDGGGFNGSCIDPNGCFTGSGG